MWVLDPGMEVPSICFCCRALKNMSNEGNTVGLVDGISGNSNSVSYQVLTDFLDVPYGADTVMVPPVRRIIAIDSLSMNPGRARDWFIISRKASISCCSKPTNFAHIGYNRAA